MSKCCTLQFTVTWSTTYSAFTVHLKTDNRPNCLNKQNDEQQVTLQTNKVNIIFPFSTGNRNRLLSYRFNEDLRDVFLRDMRFVTVGKPLDVDSAGKALNLALTCWLRNSILWFRSSHTLSSAWQPLKPNNPDSLHSSILPWEKSKSFLYFTWIFWNHGLDQREIPDAKSL